MRKDRIIMLAIFFSIAFGKVLVAENVKLTIDIGDTHLKKPIPVRSGVPLARGKLHSAENARLLIKGEEVDLQTRPIAFWPDKSIKWLLLDFMAKAGDEAILEFGNRVKRKPVRKGIKTRQDTESITVDTGIIKFSVRKDGTAFIDELALDKNGNGSYEKGETVIQAPKPGEQRYFLDYIHRPLDTEYQPLGNYMPGAVLGKSTVQITELKLEEKGPLHCVILVRGKHKIPKLAARIADQIKYDGQSDFTVRIHAYKQSGVIKAELHFVFDGVGDDDFINAWGVKLNIGKGKRFVTPGEEGMVAVNPNDQAPFAALTQESADSFKVWAGDKDRFGESVISRGNRSRGWVDIAQKDWGVTVGTRWFWQRWPNAVHYDSESGELSVMLKPPETLPTDLRRYSRYEWGVGETSAGGGDLYAWAPFASKGTANCKQIRLHFHRGEVDLEQVSAEYEAFDRLPLAKAEPEYYRQTRTTGYWFPPVAGQHEEIENAFKNFVETKWNGQQKERWYGMWNYGDYQQRFSFHKHGRWESDWGRWGWGNGDSGEGCIDKALMIQYLRTGKRHHFEQAEAMVRHRVDVDILETREYPWDYSVWRKIPPERTKGPWWDIRGTVHRHGAQHWSCMYIGGRGGTPQALRMYYYLTGNGRAADMLDIQMDAGMTIWGLGGYEKVTQRGACTDGGKGGALLAIMIAWERTGKEVYLNAFKEIIRLDLEEPQEGSYNRSVVFGFFFAVDEFADLMGDEAAKSCVLRHAKKTKTARHDYLWPSIYMLPPAAAYRLTGEQQWKELAQSLFETQVQRAQSRKIINAHTFYTYLNAIEILNIKSQ